VARQSINGHNAHDVREDIERSMSAGDAFAAGTAESS
jgi:hypothetical protein